MTISSPGSATAMSEATIASVEPQQTVISVSGSTASPCVARIWPAMASRRLFAPQVMAYWLTPSAIAWRAACLISSGASKSGKPWARLIAPWSIACRVISRMTDSVKRPAFSLVKRLFGVLPCCMGRKRSTTAPVAPSGDPARCAVHSRSMHASWRSSRWRPAMACLWGAGVLFGCAKGPAPPGAAGAGWPVSQPAAQGMDAAALAAIDAPFASGSRGYVDAMLVIRHGQAVFDRQYAQDYVRLFAGKDPVRGPYNYYDPDWHPWYRKSDLHTLQSVTKSVTSALIGIAIGRGEIPGVEVPVLRYFDAAGIANLDDRKRRLVLRDLLTMTAGIRWDE